MRTVTKRRRGTRTQFIDLRDEDRFRYPQTCGACGGPSKVDWIDLVKQIATHTCRRCGHGWMDVSSTA